MAERQLVTKILGDAKSAINAVKKHEAGLGRLGKTAEIARGVLFLVADDAGFITGSTLSINGGQHMY